MEQQPPQQPRRGVLRRILKWGGIGLGVLIVLAVILPSPDDAADVGADADEAKVGGPDQQPAACETVDAEFVETIAEGLTVTGGGELENAQALPVPDDARAGEGWPTRVVAARIVGSGMDDVIGVWATGANEGPIVPVDAVAREFSSWGAAAQPGSPMRDAMDRIRSLPVTGQVTDCAT